MKPFAVVVSLLALTPALPAARHQRKFTGTITDSMCETADHSRMKMGPTDAECTIACVEAHDAVYVLYHGGKVFQLSDRKTAEKLAGRKVLVTGTLNAAAKTIQVDSIAEVK